MEIVLSSFIGALSAIVVALIQKRKSDKNKDAHIKNIIQNLNINNKDVYIYDSTKNKKFEFETKASVKQKIIIIK